MRAGTRRPFPPACRRRGPPSARRRRPARRGGDARRGVLRVDQQRAELVDLGRALTREQEAVEGNALGVADARARNLPGVAPFFPLPPVIGGQHVNTCLAQHSSPYVASRFSSYVVSGFSRTPITHKPNRARYSRLRRALAAGVPSPGRTSCSTTIQPS